MTRSFQLLIKRLLKPTNILMISQHKYQKPKKTTQIKISLQIKSQFKVQIKKSFISEPLYKKSLFQNKSHSLSTTK
jgi:hypothetical protein